MRVIFWFVIAALEAGWCGSARVAREDSTRVRLRMDQTHRKSKLGSDAIAFYIDVA
jgi:hypothetical protein